MKHRFKKTLITSFIVLLSATAFSQGFSIEAAYDTLTMEAQFEHLFKRSNRYEEYKVMRTSAFEALKKNALDSIKEYTTQISLLKNEIKTLNKTIETQSSANEQLSDELNQTKLAQNSMSLVGVRLSKEAYNSVMWGLIICLLALATILFSLFKKGHTTVRATKKRLEEVQEDLETHRKNALVREQKLARELMDIKLKYKPNH